MMVLENDPIAQTFQVIMWDTGGFMFSYQDMDSARISQFPINRLAMKIMTVQLVFKSVTKRSRAQEPATGLRLLAQRLLPITDDASKPWKRSLAGVDWVLLGCVHHHRTL
jgi:hypothetical protein